MPRPVSEVVDDLISIYEEKFGGKGRGRYKISKSNLAHLSTRTKLQTGFINQVREMLFDEMYSLIKVVDENEESYVVIENTVFTNYREVPLRVLRKCIENSEAETAGSLYF